MKYKEYVKMFKHLLSRLGINADLKGYQYMAFVCTEIMTYSSDLSRTFQKLTMKSLYQRAAVKYGTKPKNVENRIYDAIKKIFSQGNCDFLEEIFGFSISPKTGIATNKVFIIGLCNYINNYADDVSI